MSVLTFNFALFRLAGVWRPVTWPLDWKYFCYNFYSFAVLLVMFSGAFTEIIARISFYENLEKFLKSTTILISFVANCLKAANVIDKRENILKMIQILMSDPCSPRDSEEEMIQKKYDRIIKFRSVVNVTLVGTTVGSTVIESIFRDLPNQHLLYGAWYPMNLSIRTNYLLAWIHQSMAHVFGAFISSDYDAFVSGFMLQSCAKFDILSHRFNKICRNVQNSSSKPGLDAKEEYTEEIIDCIKYHRTIIEYSRFTNDTFSSLMLLQFSVSTGVICVTVYSLSQMAINNSHFPVLIAYLSCMLLQLFLYCYAGNEVTLKSADVAEAIYCNIDWWTTRVNVQKKLFFMMLRSTRLVTFTCGKIFELSIESYKSVVKLSYSIYNVLQ